MGWGAVIPDKFWALWHVVTNGLTALQVEVLLATFFTVLAVAVAFKTASQCHLRQLFSVLIQAGPTPKAWADIRRAGFSGSFFFFEPQLCALIAVVTIASTVQLPADYGFVFHEHGASQIDFANLAKAFLVLTVCFFVLAVLVDRSSRTGRLQVRKPTTPGRILFNKVTELILRGVLFPAIGLLMYFFIASTLYWGINNLSVST